MDIAAFKISHSVGIDKDATALRAVRARSSSIGAMEEMTQTVKKCKHSPTATPKVMSTRTTAGQFKGHSVQGGEGENLTEGSNENTPHVSSSSGNVQPNQLGRTTRFDFEDLAPTHRIEHHPSWHLRFDRHGAVDAERRFAQPFP